MKKRISNLLLIIKDVARKGFFHLLSARILLRVLGFGSQLFVVKFLTPIELGQIKTMQSFTAIALILAGFGFNTSILKLCSEKRPLEERSSILKQNIKLSLISTSVVLLGLFLLAKSGVLSPDDRINKLLPIFMLSIPAIVISSMLSSYLQALKEIKRMASVQIAFRISGILALITLTYFFGIWGFIISTVSMGYILLPVFYSIVRKFISKIKFTLSKKDLYQSFYYAKWSMAANAIQRVIQYMDIFVLNFIIADRVGFGYYSIATIFLVPLREVTKSVRAISIPYFSEKQNDKKEFLRVLKKYRRLMLLQSVGISLVAVIIVPLIINYFYGERYSIASTYFSILVLGYIFHSNIALLSTSLVALGLMKYNFLSTSIYLPISIILNYLLVSSLGLIGAAIAQASTALIAMFIIMVITKKAINKHFDEVDKNLSHGLN